LNYDEYLNSPEWKALREKIKRRDGGRCRLCGGSDDLHVHHRSYEHFGNEHPSDLTTLCRWCHELYTAGSRTPKPRRWDREPKSVRAGLLRARIEAIRNAERHAKDRDEEIDHCIERRRLERQLAALEPPPPEPHNGGDQ
jgi:hypothetical protein